MSKKKVPADFVKWFQSQLKAFRARRFEQLDVEAVGNELEGALGKYRGEVRHRAELLMRILMRAERVYGDWDDLKGEWNLLRCALEDSPSLARTVRAQIKRAYESARLKAELHGEGRWPARCPWPTLAALARAVRARDREYRDLERRGDRDFVDLRPLRTSKDDGGR